MSKVNMLEALEQFDKVFGDRFFREQIGYEISKLREALESGDADEIEEALGETVDGCDTAMARLFDAWWMIEDFNKAREAYEQATVDAINDFENAE